MTVIEHVVGVYDADGTPLGELSYWIGARVGRRHCALCDITHGNVRERADWKARRAQLPFPFITIHRDEVPADVRATVEVPPPYVAAVTDEGVVLLLDRADIEACHGDPEELIAAVEAATSAHGLT